jgi:hypothetical protein
MVTYGWFERENWGWPPFSCFVSEESSPRPPRATQIGLTVSAHSRKWGLRKNPFNKYVIPWESKQQTLCTSALKDLYKKPRSRLQHTATHCNTLQHTATHCNILQQRTKVATLVSLRLLYTCFFNGVYVHEVASAPGIHSAVLWVGRGSYGAVLMTSVTSWYHSWHQSLVCCSTHDIRGSYAAVLMTSVTSWHQSPLRQPRTCVNVSQYYSCMRTSSPKEP